MKILAIETSCDETAVAVVDASGDERSATFDVQGNALFSQIELHREYGGVFPTIAKREHAANLVPITQAALAEAELLESNHTEMPDEIQRSIESVLSREKELTNLLIEFIEEHDVPNIDVIAVTHGPGLAPALWVGVTFAQALARAWDKPLIGVNHMEGHILSALAQRNDAGTLAISSTKFPILALLISGGHTELVLMKDWHSYELIGQTRDDAVGEAFDKVARMMDLPYPGGPEISKLAEEARTQGLEEAFSLPRPMVNSSSCDFSFAGLKTAVLYTLKEFSELTEEDRKHVAHAFENAATDVLLAKTLRAIEETGAQTVVLGGGVSANTHIKRIFTERIAVEYPDALLNIPTPDLTTDNAIMIALAGFYRALKGEFVSELTANGNLSLTQDGT